MASQGPLGCGTGADDAGVGTLSWTNVSNITADDGNNATANSAGSGTTHYLKATNFGFTIPSGATINGLVVDWKRHASSGTITDNRIRVIKGGVIGATEEGSGSTWNTTEETDTFGGSAVLWGETWTTADINASNFGFAMSANINANQARVNYVQATVYYTEGASFDPSTAYFSGFTRSQTRVLAVRHTNRSTVSAGVLEMTLVTEPTQAWFIKGRGITPPPQRAPGAKAVRPDMVPADQLPPLGWQMQPKGQAPRAPFVPNRSTFAIPTERFPPFPDSWLTVNRRMVPEPKRGTPRTWFTLPLERTPPNPDAWLTNTRKGIWPKDRAGKGGIWQVLKPFDFPLANVLARPAPAPRRGNSSYVLPDVPTVPMPGVLVARPQFPVPRGSVRIVPATFQMQEAADLAAMFLSTGGRLPYLPARMGARIAILEPTSTGILTLGFLRPLVARPYVAPGQLARNATRIVWTPQTISTAFRQDNRNARGRSQNDQTGTALPHRNATGIGNT